MNLLKIRWKLPYGLFFTKILICLTVALYGQENNQISGYVIDQETGNPVPYASLGVPEQQKGISANINGYFRLLIPEFNRDYHLQISSIGYKRLRIPLSEIDLNQEQRFYLVPEPKVLDEIIIVGKTQTLEDLVKTASKNRKIYLRSTPYLMNGFYREILKVENEYQGFTESQGILYMNGYNPRYKNNSKHLTYDLIQWKNTRRSDYPQPHYLEVAALLKAKDYYLHQGPLHSRNLGRLEYNVTDSTSYQDHLVLEISFAPRQDASEQIPYSGKMFVKEDDQALLRMEIEANGPEPFLKASDAEQSIHGNFEINFIFFENQYYLGHCSYHRSFTADGKQTDWYTELFGASFANQPAMFLNYNQRAVLFSEMLNPKVNYNPGFWDEFSFVQHSYYQEISSEWQQDLADEFEDNHNKRLKPLPEGYENYEQIANDRNTLDFIMQR